MRTFTRPSRLRSLCKLFNHQSAICNPQSFRFFSLHQQRTLLILALSILALLYFRLDHPSHVLPDEEMIREIAVEVLGEVHHPGIHLLKNPPTLEEAITKAGGLKDVPFDMERPSELLETGTLVMVAKENQGMIKVKFGRMEAKKLLVLSIPLDLNRVTAEDLFLIPGIGESLAQEMIAYRERRRAFRSMEELRNVKGIGEKKDRTLKPFLIVRP
jgi:competence protein ComEA